MLQVVKNPGWMTPYVACMLVMTGMLAHFGVTLTRFLAAQTPRPASGLQHAGEAGAGRIFAHWVFPALVVLLFAGYIGGKTRMPHSAPERNANLRVRQAAARLPGPHQAVRHAGPQHAANPLRPAGSARHRQGRQNDQAARHRWLLDAISDAPAAADHRVFRIENLELLETLGLKPREGSWRYSIRRDPRQIRRIARSRSTWPPPKPEGQRSRFQKRCFELASKLSRYATLVKSFRSPAIVDRARRIRRQSAAGAGRHPESARCRGPAGRAAGRTRSAAGRR